MPIRIEAKAGHRLQVSGDIETVLDIPARGIARGFSLAFSGGTLVLGRWIPVGNACSFGIASEGAVMARITRHGLAEALALDGISIGSRCPAASSGCTQKRVARATACCG